MFFAEITGEPFPPRWRTTADFGPSRFGWRDSEPDGTYAGRRVDPIGRSLKLEPTAEHEQRFWSTCEGSNRFGSQAG